MTSSVNLLFLTRRPGLYSRWIDWAVAAGFETTVASDVEEATLDVPTVALLDSGDCPVDFVLSNRQLIDKAAAIVERPYLSCVGCVDPDHYLMGILSKSYQLYDGHSALDSMFDIPPGGDDSFQRLLSCLLTMERPSFTKKDLLPRPTLSAGLHVAGFNDDTLADRFLSIDPTMTIYGSPVDLCGFQASDGSTVVIKYNSLDASFFASDKIGWLTHLIYDLFAGGKGQAALLLDFVYAPWSGRLLSVNLGGRRPIVEAIVAQDEPYDKVARMSFVDSIRHRL